MEMDEDNVFDLDVYASSYRGHMKVARLLHVANNSRSSTLVRKALVMAVQELRQNSVNTSLYTSVVDQAQSQLGDEVTLDKLWLEKVTAESKQVRAQLEEDHSAAKTNGIREAMRYSLMDLGRFFYDRGDFFLAAKMYLRTRDHCASPTHVLAFCMAVIKTYVHSQNWHMVTTYVHKAEAVVESACSEATLKITKGQLAAASGLVHFVSGRFRNAANSFADLPAEMGNTFDDVVAGADVARYGVLAALSSYNRSALRTRLLNNPSFTLYLEYAVEVREMLDAFCSSRFAEAFRALEEMRPTLELDLYASGQLNALLQQIRCRVLQQYTAPYKSLRLVDMAEGLGCDVAAMEAELSDLIVKGSINARIDSHNKVLYKQQTDERQLLMSNVIKAADEYIATARMMILRTELARNGLKPSILDDEGGVGSERHSRSRFGSKAGQLLTGVGEGIGNWVHGFTGRFSRGGGAHDFDR